MNGKGVEASRPKPRKSDGVQVGGYQTHPQVRLWSYRMLFNGNVYKTLVRERDFADDSLGRWLGFGSIIDGEPGAEQFDRDRIVAQLRSQWREVEKAIVTCDNQSGEWETVALVGKVLGISKLECDIVAFRLSCNCLPLHGLTGLLGLVGFEQIVEILGACLGYRREEIRKALAPTSLLVEGGLVEVWLNEPRRFQEGFDVDSAISEELAWTHSDPFMYFRSVLLRASASRLSAEDFPHVRGDIEVLCRYVAHATAAKEKGVNILLYGEPGTGKSEFVRMIAAKLGFGLHEVASSGRDGVAMRPRTRFRAFKLGQSLLRGATGQILLFDEIEDVFLESDVNDLSGDNTGKRKAWVNRLMETNPVPTFWVSNNIKMIDRAFLRRFSYVLEIKIPPRSVRSRILERYLGDLPISENWKARTADHEGIAPAVIESAAKVVKSANEQLAPSEMERTLSRVIGNTLEVMGLPRESKNGANAGAISLGLFNVDCDMAQVVEGLKAHGDGRICLYGPPGTGKSAFGRYVASALDRPLMTRRASDIISPWLGETEKNMAEMFRSAKEDNAVLLLDEADSFLRDRSGAERSWEITEVNEMLTQMESFEGIFIASTNLMASLDSAALRRFDLKLRLDYLRPEQVRSLFSETCLRLGIGDDIDVRAPLSKMTRLAPGDFENAVRQARLRPIKSSLALLQRLREECDIKPEGRHRPIGFAA